MLYLFRFENRQNRRNTDTIISSQCRFGSAHPLTIDTRKDRIGLEIMVHRFIRLRNHIHVSLKNNRLAVFHTGCGRFANNDIPGLIQNGLQSQRTTYTHYILGDFIEMTRRTRHLTNRIEIFPYCLRLKRCDFVVHSENFIYQ